MLDKILHNLPSFYHDFYENAIPAEMIGMAKRPTKFLAFVGLAFCTLLQGKNRFNPEKAPAFRMFFKNGPPPYQQNADLVPRRSNGALFIVRQNADSVVRGAVWRVFGGQ